MAIAEVSFSWGLAAQNYGGVVDVLTAAFAGVGCAN